MKTVFDLVGLWPRPIDFANDAGVEWMTAHQWRRRNKIPPEYWSALVKGAELRGIPLSVKLLADIHAAKKRGGHPPAKKRSHTEAAA